MLLKFGFLILVPVAVLYCFVFLYFPEYSVSKVDMDGFYGEGTPRADNEIISDYVIDVDMDRVQAFKAGVLRGLAALPPSMEGVNFELGVGVQYLHSLNQSFESYNWKQHEHFLNTFKHYRTEIEGLDLHFLRHDFPLKKGQKKVPLLLIHGFGSSFWDFYKVIPILANPTRFGYDFGREGQQIVFDVIVPSIPGFGFSQAPAKPGVGAIQVARMLGTLMERLGSEKYFVHGSAAIGSEIGASLALIRPQSVQGLHLVNPRLTLEFNEVLEYKRIASKLLFGEFSLGALEGSDKYERPDVQGLSFVDSPLSATIFLFDIWAKGVNHPEWKTHPQGGLQSHNTVDEIVTEAHIFWLGGNAPSSLRFMHFTHNDPKRAEFSRATINTPTGVLTTPRVAQPNSQFFYSHRFRSIRRFVEAEAGGEFIAIENPDLLAKEIFSFVEAVLP